MTIETSKGRHRSGVLAALIVVFTVTASGAARASSTPASSKGPEGVIVYKVPDLAPSSTTQGGQTVDGISCRTQAKEKVAYHVHVHVGIYVRGAMMRVPAGVGITRPYLTEHYSSGPFLDVGLYDCLYWLHTHVADGIVHVEAPAKRTFTLGQFFAIWNQPLTSHQVGPFKGAVVIFENGRRLTGDPARTPLLAGGNIQIDVGSPVVAFVPFHFKVTGGCGQGSNGCSSTSG